MLSASDGGRPANHLFFRRTALRTALFIGSPRVKMKDGIVAFATFVIRMSLWPGSIGRRTRRISANAARAFCVARTPELTTGRRYEYRCDRPGRGVAKGNRPPLFLLVSEV